MRQGLSQRQREGLRRSPGRGCWLGLLLGLLYGFVGAGPAQAAPRPPDMVEHYVRDYVTARYPGLSLDRLLYVSVADARLYVFEQGHVVRGFPISSAAEGTGNRMGSGQTPTGLHSICEKYGDGAPIGTVFRARVNTGKRVRVVRDGRTGPLDTVTTRILRLCGEEPGVNHGGNVDSYRRYVYIHGTPYEGLIGRPASRGCIRMSNAGIVELYNRVVIGTKVLILPR